MGINFFKKLIVCIENRLDNFTIKKKLIIMYVFCVIVPLVITDSVLLGIVLGTEKRTRQHEMENIANAVRYNLSSEVEGASKLAKGIYTSRYIDDVLNHQYESELEYDYDYREKVFNKIDSLSNEVRKNLLILKDYKRSSSASADLNILNNIPDSEYELNNY